MTTDPEAILATVRDRVDPSPDEAARLEEAVQSLTDRAERAIEDLPVEADTFLVGSTARGTWISGEEDIDLFVRFPRDLDRDDLESFGLQIGHAVLPEGREEFAEHPYVTGKYDGFDVDLVPCYDVDSANEIESAVDRTPFHTAYLEEKLTPTLRAEVRVFKQFLKGIGVYGSNLRTRGFSGYLTELLVLEYGSAAATLDAAVDWQPPVELDPADHGTRSFEDPLVVVDPTDPERNVAAVLSADNRARLQHHAREFLADPSLHPFFPEEREPLSVDAIRSVIESRETTPVALVFETPDLVDDELYPQLRKSLAGIRRALERRGFDVFRADHFVADRCVLLFEFAVETLPAVERHEGPPVHVTEHAKRFWNAYASADAHGPFIDGDRYVVEREREFTSAIAFLRDDALFEARLGPAIEDSLADGFDVKQGTALAGLADSFDAALTEYLYPSP